MKDLAGLLPACDERATRVGSDPHRGPITLRDALSSVLEVVGERGVVIMVPAGRDVNGRLGQTRDVVQHSVVSGRGNVVGCGQWQ